MASNSTRPRPIRRKILVGVAIITVLALVRIPLGIGAAMLHFSNTPDFATYLNQYPVSEPLPEKWWPVARLLAGEEAWTIGEVDPFSLTEDDPNFLIDICAQQIQLFHGEQLLLDLEQEIAFAFDRESGERVGFGARTVRCQSAPEMRAAVRIWVWTPQELLLPVSGSIIFDAMVVAGSGDDRLEIVEYSGREGPPAIPRQDKWPSLWRGVVGLVHPADPISSEGLAHRFHRRISTNSWGMSGVRGSTRGTSAGVGQLEHWVSTLQYSHSFDAPTTGSMPTGTQFDLTYTTNGEVW